MSDPGDRFKVKLEESGVTARRVVFKVTPDISENRNVNYKTIDPLHAPGSIQIYSNSASRTFNLSSVKFISRTRKEATRNLLLLNRLRGWTMPYFGARSSTLGLDKEERSQVENRLNRSKYDADSREIKAGGATSQERIEIYNDLFGRELLGSPPPIVLLSAYTDTSISSAKLNTARNLHRIPCVITQLSIPYPSDVDYIPTENGTPFPIILTIDMSLTETHSPVEYQKFSLQDYRQGKLPNF